MLTRFFEANSGKFLFENLAPFEKFYCCEKEEARPGGDIMNMRRKNISRNNIMHGSTGWRTHLGFEVFQSNVFFEK